MRILLDWFFLLYAVAGLGSAINSGRYQWVYNRMIALIDNFKINSNASGFYRVQHSCRQVATRGKAALQHHKMIIEIHGAGRHHTFTGGNDYWRHRAADLITVKQFPAVFAKQNSTQGLFIQRFSKPANNFMGSDNNAAIARDRGWLRQLEFGTLNCLQNFIWAQQRIRIAKNEPANRQPQAEKILNLI